MAASDKNKKSKKSKQEKTNLIAFIALLALAVVVIAVIVGVSIKEKNKPEDEIPDVSGAEWYADIVIRDYGTITVALDSEAAPLTVANFVSLAQSGFYDGLTFHRIMAGFMMQGGDPRGNGSGNSGTRIKGEFSANGWEKNTIQHTRGVISMARSSDSYDSASCQFFIMQESAPHLDGQYAAFGYVTSGIEVVDAVCDSARPTDRNGTIPSNQQPVIETIRVYQHAAESGTGAH